MCIKGVVGACVSRVVWEVGCSRGYTVTEEPVSINDAMEARVCVRVY